MPFFLIMEQIFYTEENAKALIAKVQSGGGTEDYLLYYFKKLKEELCVHTQGKLFDKVITVFNNEEPEASKFVLDTYESVTKGSIWRGIDNISRIFNNTGFDVTGDEQAISGLNEGDFFANYVNDFISLSTAIDPNTVQVWLKDEKDDWSSRFIKTDFIKFISEDEICFILEEESDYTLRTSTTKIYHDYQFYNNDPRTVKKSFFEGLEYVWGENLTFIYINKDQYIKIKQDKKDATVEFYTFETTLKSPYSYTGVEKIEKGVYHSAVAGFIPFGNHALIQHRTYRSVEAIFGYPRMSEVELPCEHCVRGQESCDPCDEFPSGIRTCRTCHGTGHVSMQSPFKIYKRKLFPEAPELNVNIKPVEFFTPDIAILNYNSEAWMKTLQMGEDAIYIQQRVETGNIESAKSREKQLESMYSWLGRIGSVIYSNIQTTIDNYCLIKGFGKVTVNKPISYAIMNELEAFDYLNAIVSTDAPVFIKTSHIENFLNKYISKTSPVISVVDILKRVDPFVFYATKDLQMLSDSGVINDEDWRMHSYAFPLLMQMYTKNPNLFDSSYEEIEKQLSVELAKKSGSTVIDRPLEQDDNSEEMINGVIDMLRQVQDMDNRMAIAQNRINDFRSEGVDFDEADFLARLR